MFLVAAYWSLVGCTSESEPDLGSNGGPSGVEPDGGHVVHAREASATPTNQAEEVSQATQEPPSLSAQDAGGAIATDTDAVVAPRPTHEPSDSGAGVGALDASAPHPTGRSSAPTDAAVAADGGVVDSSRGEECRDVLPATLCVDSPDEAVGSRQGWEVEGRITRVGEGYPEGTTCSNPSEFHRLGDQADNTSWFVLTSDGQDSTFAVTLPNYSTRTLLGHEVVISYLNVMGELGLDQRKLVLQNALDPTPLFWFGEDYQWFSPLTLEPLEPPLALSFADDGTCGVPQACGGKAQHSLLCEPADLVNSQPVNSQPVSLPFGTQVEVGEWLVSNARLEIYDPTLPDIPTEYSCDGYSSAAQAAMWRKPYLDCPTLASVECELTHGCTLAASAAKQAIAVECEANSATSEKWFTGSTSGLEVLHYDQGPKSVYAFHDPDTEQLVGWLLADEAGATLCAGQVPANTAGFMIEADANDYLSRESLCAPGSADAGIAVE